MDVTPAASPTSTFTNTDASTILAVTFLITASTTCLIMAFMNSSRDSVSVILSTSSKDFSTHPQTRSFTSVAGMRDSMGLELLPSPLELLPNTHSVDPSNLRCHVFPSLAESFLTGVLSTVVPSGSLSVTVSPFLVYFPESLTRVNVGTMTSLSPGAMLPDSSMVLFLQSDDADRVYPSRSMVLDPLFRSSTHSLPVSSPGGLVSNSLIRSPVWMGAEYLSVNPASMLAVAPSAGRGMELSICPTPGMSLSLTPSSW